MHIFLRDNDGDVRDTGAGVMAVDHVMALTSRPGRPVMLISGGGDDGLPGGFAESKGPSKDSRIGPSLIIESVQRLTAKRPST